MDPEEPSVSSTTTPSSPSEENRCDYISSYTQISQFDSVNTPEGDKTDVESSGDEFSEDQQSPRQAEALNEIPLLSSQIIGWSQQKFKSYEIDNETSSKMNDDSSTMTIEEETSSISERIDETYNKSNQLSDEKRRQLYFFQKSFLDEIEANSLRLSQNLNLIMKDLNNYTTDVTSTTIDSVEIYKENVQETCAMIDADIKLMYKVIAKCEELNKSLRFIDGLRDRIKDIKQALDTFERIVM